MPVIAMTQEMATLGKDVALGLCEALGLQQVRHEIGDVVAGRMHVQKSLIRRIREGKASFRERWRTDEKAISIFTTDEVFDLAAKGNVLIRGWGAAYLLQSVPHVACVRVCAPLDVRVKRLMQRLETADERLARREIEADDAAHRSRMSAHFGVNWGDPTLYDLTLNTGRITVQTCVDQVIALASSPAFAETPSSRQRILDLALQARARAALREDPRTAAVEVLVEGSAGRLRLCGVVLDEHEKSLARSLVASLPGVKGVDDELRTLAGETSRLRGS
jgi:cytidylate kinase